MMENLLMDVIEAHAYAYINAALILFGLICIPLKWYRIGIGSLVVALGLLFRRNQVLFIVLAPIPIVYVCINAALILFGLVCIPLKWYRVGVWTLLAALIFFVWQNQAVFSLLLRL